MSSTELRDKLAREHAELEGNNGNAIISFESGWNAREPEFEALKSELAVARERLGPAGYKIIKEVDRLKKQLEIAKTGLQKYVKGDHRLGLHTASDALKQISQLESEE